MAAVKIKDYSQGVAVVANDLLSGRSVYRANGKSWMQLDGSQFNLAAVVFDEQAAYDLLRDASADVLANRVIDPYLVQLDRSGLPIHIRERLRVSGPSINFASGVNQEAANVSI